MARMEPPRLAKMTSEAYAKVNLTLEVFGVRGDGYHALRSVVAPISLSDTIEIEPAETLSSDSPYPDDLCLKAAVALRSTAAECGLRPADGGAAIHVAKRIPAGGGLGGGSADAAAVLRSLNEMWRLGLSPEALARIGAQVGSDVPALVLAQHYRSPVIMEGRGEDVRLLDVEAESAGRRRATGAFIDLVLVNPGVHTSTREVFSLAGVRSPGEASATEECARALLSGDLKRIVSSFVNDLTLPACRLHPEISDAISSLRAAGAAGVAMSGSGSTVFGVVASESEGERVAGIVASGGMWARHVRMAAV